MSRVGVLGGTFDPVHFGHLRAAEVARDELELDRVVFVPAANPPHKRAEGVSPASARVEMLDRVLSEVDGFELSTIEVERGGASYTIDTLGALTDENPGDEYWFITGSDAFIEIRTWKDWSALLERYSFVVHGRPGVSLEDAASTVPEKFHEHVVFVKREMLNVSSTEIRRSARQGRSIRFLVPEAVDDYVRRNRLYQ